MRQRFSLILVFVVSRALIANDVVPTLINGTPADPKDWPASVYASMGNSRCSATVVGERVLLIAAHCVSSNSRANFSVGPNSYQSTCSYSSQYPANATADWALCVINKPVTGIVFEVVNQDPNLVKVGDKVTLTGYGCVNPGSGTGGNDGTYRVGTSTVTDVPSGNNNDIVTKRGAALCYGDSGGPAFYGQGETRKVISVNSRGDISSQSMLSSVSTPSAIAFITSWANRNSQKICGVHADATGCRNSAPQIANEFTLQSRSMTLTGKMKSGYEARLDRFSFSLGLVLNELEGN